MGYLFIKGYIYFINIFVFGGLLSYWEFLDFVEESYI